MNRRQTGNYLFSAALALAAGVVGSAMTLLLVHKLAAPALIAPPVSTVESALPDTDTLTGLSPNQNGSAHASVVLQNNSATDTLDSQSDDNGGQHLERAFEDAAAERGQLAEVLAQLTRQIETLESDIINIKSQDVLDEALMSEARQPVDSPVAFGNPSEFGDARSASSRIDSLIASGVDVDRAQALQASQNQYQLARLELFDLAEREGWADSEVFSERLEELDEQRPDLRTELGDDAYDRYLFEAGRSNRVVVSSIIPGSAADIAGFRAGDMVLSYADQRVFSTRDLQRATRSGDRGEAVAVVVEREEQTLFFDVPRGPLGVTLSAQQQSPS